MAEPKKKQQQKNENVFYLKCKRQIEIICLGLQWECSALLHADGIKKYRCGWASAKICASEVKRNNEVKQFVYSFCNVVFRNERMRQLCIYL